MTEIDDCLLQVPQGTKPQPTHHRHGVSGTQSRVDERNRSCVLQSPRDESAATAAPRSWERATQPQHSTSTKPATERSTWNAAERQYQFAKSATDPEFGTRDAAYDAIRDTAAGTAITAESDSRVTTRLMSPSDVSCQQLFSASNSFFSANSLSLSANYVPRSKLCYVC